jgi:hypothetical protein
MFRQPLVEFTNQNITPVITPEREQQQKALKSQQQTWQPKKAVNYFGIFSA